MTGTTAVRAALFQTPERDRLEHRTVVVEVDAAGLIAQVHDAHTAAAADAIANAATVVSVPDGSVLLPGLVDLHVHAPQWPQLGTGLDLPLEQWLFEHTFPLEARYADAAFATSVWDSLVPTLLAHGTTTAVYYATVHEAATTALGEACVRHGQRAFVGRVAMDHPEGTPEWYRDVSASAAVDASQRSIESITNLFGNAGLVRPIITPRFIPACSDALLAGLGELAAATGELVQTHCSESDWEHAYVLDRFGVTDSVRLAQFGLARDHSVLAHCGHVTAADLGVLSSIGAGVAHCPLSNSYFGDAVFPTRKALDGGVRVGLGTDIAGGSGVGLLGQAAMAVTVSRMLEDGVDAAVARAKRGVAGSRIDAVEAFWLATCGGADVLGIAVGLIEPGRQFDAIVVDTARSGSGLRYWPEVDSAERLFEKIVRLAGAADITDVWVAGRKVTG